VVAMEPSQHGTVVVSPQDSLDDDVKAGRKRMPGGEVNQGDIRAPGDVTFSQHYAPQYVLADDRQVASPVSFSDRRGDRGLSGGGVATQDDEPRVFRPGVRHASW
jgi:hypothetical protein